MATKKTPASKNSKEKKTVDMTPLPAGITEVWVGRKRYKGAVPTDKIKGLPDGLRKKISDGGKKPEVRKTDSGQPAGTGGG